MKYLRLATEEVPREELGLGVELAVSKVKLGGKKEITRLRVKSGECDRLINWMLSFFVAW